MKNRIIQALSSINYIGLWNTQFLCRIFMVLLRHMSQLLRHEVPYSDCSAEVLSLCLNPAFRRSDPMQVCTRGASLTGKKKNGWYLSDLQLTFFDNIPFFNSDLSFQVLSRIHSNAVIKLTFFVNKYTLLCHCVIFSS